MKNLKHLKNKKPKVFEKSGAIVFLQCILFFEAKELNACEESLGFIYNISRIDPGLMMIMVKNFVIAERINYCNCFEMILHTF